ncbi:glycoside hydrolase family 38 C-terminal domain-containing protein [Companilactobacillus huachuanensis]|uniref:Glycoside hydrolase family 38 C-terminal domain-containing protein n=1 Tax=Companilactobacillus huachuanensis TaxID=2559914 RepID=A0ABW1RN21_9LACO|nr:glycoside hydrolase family 38 C-terminal domain-containing protein [Companilactobacillus huachuanensis]
MKKISIVNHTHWDREWYFSAEDSIFLSDKLFTDAIVELENHPGTSFTLDGQISILDDYIKIRPEMLGRVKKLVDNGQLIIGPWYTQPDALHIKGESLLRNGMIGIFDSKKYGQYLHVGYLPDTFGFNSQIPVILNELGLHSFIFWRGINPQKIGGYYFNWKSLGKGNQVTAVNMPQGYGTGMLLSDNHAYVDKRLDTAIEFIQKFEKGNDILIPSGNDQLDIIKDFQRKIKNINKIGKYDYEISDYQTFVDKVSQRDDLPEYIGEFIDPVLARVHRSSSSSRMNIKLKSRRLENLLIKKAEPMLVIGRSVGLDISQQLLIRSWKKLLESQAHDSMAGSVTDPVEQDIMHRLTEGIQIAEDIVNMVENLIAKKINLTKDEILLFNPDGHRFHGYKTVELLTKSNDPKIDNCVTEIISQEYVVPRDNVLMQDETGDHYIKESGYYISKALVKVELPALGYKVFKVISHDSSEKMQQSENAISNNILSINFMDGKVDLTYQNQILKDVLLIEDVANDGDTYDFSPLRNGQKFMLPFDHCETDVHHDFSKMILTGGQELPKSQVENTYQGQMEKVTYRLTMFLLPNDNRIRMQFDFDNTVLNHRVRVGLRTGIHAKTNIASVPFGFIERDNEIVPHDNWAETPVNIYPFDSSVSLSNENVTVTAISKDISEYQQSDDILWLTILTSTNELGKPNLVYRPGRASGDTTKQGHVMIQTPDGELLGSISEQFSVLFTKKMDHLNIQQAVNGDDLSIPSYQEQELNLFHNRLDNKIQFPTIEKSEIRELELFNLPKDYLISSIYPSYTDQSAIIVRLENVGENKIVLNKDDFGKNVEVVNALEDKENLDFTIAPMSVISLKINY